MVFVREAGQFNSGNKQQTGEWASFISMIQKMDEISAANQTENEAAAK